MFMQKIHAQDTYVSTREMRRTCRARFIDRANLSPLRILITITIPVNYDSKTRLAPLADFPRANREN